MPYFAYMLRMWSSEQNGSLVWRASLESAHDSERYVFADLESLTAFLQQQTAHLDPVEAEVETLSAKQGRET